MLTRLSRASVASLLLVSVMACSSAVPSASPPAVPSAASSEIPPVSPSESLAPGATPVPAESAAPGPVDTATPEYSRAYGDPDPVDVDVELSPVTFTSTVTNANGGFFSLAAPDGTLYQLDIPGNAVLSDLDVTMTIVSSINGSPLGDQLVGAVQLEPAGLRLVAPATLEITPAVPVTVDEEGPFAADSDGRNFHMFPLVADPSVLRMELTHFSIFGLFKTDAERRQDMIRRTAADVHSQLEQEMSKLGEEARKDGGGQVDPERAAEIINYYRDRVVRPLLALAEKDHKLFMEAFQKWSSWERQRQLLLGTEDVDQSLLESLSRAFANYIDHIKERCYEHDFGAIYDIMALAKENEMMGFLLGEFGQSEAFDFIDKCATFTLEMDSAMEADLTSCMFIDAGLSDVEESDHISAAVEIRAMLGGPWNGPNRWESATYEADCNLPARGGGNLVECGMHFAGFAEAGQLAVLQLSLDLNNLNRPKPRPPQPQPSAPPQGSASPGGSPGSSGSPPASGPPTPRPTQAPEETISELIFKAVLVQPGDPQIFFDGDCSVLGFTGGSETRRGSGGWLAGWKDNTSVEGIAREYVNHPVFGEAYWLRGWEPVTDGSDIVARAEYSGGTQTAFGTTNEDTTFVIRHTPRR